MFKKINRFFFPSQIIYSLVLFILMVIIFFIYRDIDHSFNTVEKEYLELQSQDIESFSRNISEYLQHHLHFKNIDELKKDPECIEKISNLLALFSTKHYRFIYILYLDDMGKLRYFADGSYEKSQRGIFGQKFDPESNVWKKALEENKIVHVQQHTFTDLWSTYYCPLNISNQYKLLLVFDISLESLDNFR
ncbi:MAG: hypothetical protein GXO11_02440, partial [Epsilonproteobacteria bacterium]|nr:hypothetical protein [Campylobacterota bacterium]